LECSKVKMGDAGFELEEGFGLVVSRDFWVMEMDVA
jgi:hypothetical protein